jgi:hypothetical protein
MTGFMQVHVHTDDRRTFSAKSAVFCGGAWMSGFMERHALRVPTRITMETVRMRMYPALWMAVCLFEFASRKRHAARGC